MGRAKQFKAMRVRKNNKRKKCNIRPEKVSFAQTQKSIDVHPMTYIDNIGRHLMHSGVSSDASGFKRRKQMLKQAVKKLQKRGF